MWLGSVDKSQPILDGGAFAERKKAGGCLIVFCGAPSGILDFVKEAFDPIS